MTEPRETTTPKRPKGCYPARRLGVVAGDGGPEDGAEDRSFGMPTPLRVAEEPASIEEPAGGVVVRFPASEGLMGGERAADAEAFAVIAATVEEELAKRPLTPDARQALLRLLHQLDGASQGTRPKPPRSPRA